MDQEYQEFQKYQDYQEYQEYPEYQEYQEYQEYFDKRNIFWICPCSVFLIWVNILKLQKLENIKIIS